MLWLVFTRLNIIIESNTIWWLTQKASQAVSSLVYIMDKHGVRTEVRTFNMMIGCEENSFNIAAYVKHGEKKQRIRNVVAKGFSGKKMLISDKGLVVDVGWITTLVCPDIYSNLSATSIQWWNGQLNHQDSIGYACIWVIEVGYHQKISSED